MCKLTLELIRQETAFRSLEPEWNALLRQSGSDSIFLSWEWISTWWEVFGSRFELRIVTARSENGELLGVAPLMVGRGRGAFGRYVRRLMMIGQEVETQAEYLDFFVKSDRVMEVTRALCEYLTERQPELWDMVEFHLVPANSPNLSIVEHILTRYGCEWVPPETTKGHFTELPESWDEYMRMRSKHFRRNWRSYSNRLNRAGDVRYLLAGTDVPLDQAMGMLIELNRDRYGRRGQSFRTDDYVLFHKRLSAQLLDRDSLFLLLLALNDTVVAARYGFLYGDKIWEFQGGWRRDCEKLQVAFLLTGAAIQWGIEHGYREYDFLAGDRAYKRRWGTGEREFLTLRALTSRWPVSLNRRWLNTRRRLAGAVAPRIRRAVRRYAHA